jgi:competence ComEA-like helix-hairpin-helix protein
MGKKIARDGRLLVLILMTAVMLPSLASDREGKEAVLEATGQGLQWDQDGLFLTGRPTESMRHEYPGKASPLLFAKIPVNRAGVELLQTIPGIGREFAQRIVTERQENGNYANPDELMRVSGIGVKRAAQFEKQLRFD